MKLLLVIDVDDDVTEAYEDFTVDYDLRGTPKEDRTVNKSIKYVEDCPIKPMPHKLQADWYTDGYKEGFNACLEEIEKC